MIGSAVTVFTVHNGNVQMTWWSVILWAEFLVLLMVIVVVLKAIAESIDRHQ